MKPLATLPEGAVCIQVKQNTFWLLPEKALFWLEQNALLVADVHIGKALAFRRLGVPVPSGTTKGNLEKLTSLIDLLKPAKLYVLGDLLHASAAQDLSVVDAMLAWRKQHAEVSIVLIRGNHDAKAGAPAPKLDIQVVSEPHSVQDFNLLHAPPDQQLAQAPVFSFCGHVHPVVSMNGKGKDRLRLSCFVVSATHILLPAFGEFTGGFEIVRHQHNQIYVVAGSSVIAL